MKFPIIVPAIFALLASAFAADTTTTSTSTTTSTTTTSTETPTTVSPQPVVPNPIANFTLKSNTTVCVVGQFSGVIDLTIAGKQLNWTVNGDTVLNQADSHCDDSKVYLKFDIAGNDNVTFSLALAKANSSYALNDVELIYKVTDKNVTTGYQLSSNATVFTVNDDHSYACFADQKIPLVDQKVADKATATLSFQNFKLDAFRTSNTTEYRTAAECAMDQKPRDFVPLAVAIALIALIVIVLISYLIGRKRSRRLAYESV